MGTLIALCGLCFLLLDGALTSTCVSPSEHQKLVEEVKQLKESYKDLADLVKHSSAKRCVLDGEFDIEKEVITLHNEVETLKSDRGSTYVRWGRTSCQPNATSVYDGYVGSNWYADIGGPANYVCLPKHPTWAKYLDGFQNESNYIYGTEYEDETEGTFNPFSRHMDDHDVPCVVCRAPRPTTLMIPARTSCYSGWHMEYTGYLMTMSRKYHSSSEYICVDGDPEDVPRGNGNQNGGLLYVVEAACGSLACPPYVNGRELACVVCSK